MRDAEVPGDALRQHLDVHPGLAARLLKLDGLDPQITSDGTLDWGTLADADLASELVFLGLLGGKGCFAEVSPKLLGSVAPANPRLWAAMSRRCSLAMARASRC